MFTWSFTAFKIYYIMSFLALNVLLILVHSSYCSKQGRRQRWVQGVSCNPPFKLMVYIEVCHAAAAILWSISAYRAAAAER